ncbi:hypothetical protein [Pseudomonas panipatensis]|uniref:hypothetical protein n=1 Tax=Pseudomonas panipatensis TaxID=428992 RepID=UPI0035B2781E
MIRWLLPLFALLLAGCAQRSPLPTQAPDLPLPLQLHIQRLSGQETQDWLLVIQREGPALRWSLIDPLGIPLSRQLLRDQQWQNDGLLPPNPEARELFAVLLFAQTPITQLASHYPPSRYRTHGSTERWLDGRWRIEYTTARDLLIHGEGIDYKVSPLSNGGAP